MFLFCIPNIIGISNPNFRISIIYLVFKLINVRLYNNKKDENNSRLRKIIFAY